MSRLLGIEPVILQHLLTLLEGKVVGVGIHEQIAIAGANRAVAVHDGVLGQGWGQRYGEAYGTAVAVGLVDTARIGRGWLRIVRHGES